MTDVVDDPRYPDRIGPVGGPMIPCKVTEFSVTTAPTAYRSLVDGDVAVYDSTRAYRIEYETPPSTAPEPVTVRLTCERQPCYETFDVSEIAGHAGATNAGWRSREIAPFLYAWQCPWHAAGLEVSGV